MITIGIDPGLTGAMALIHSEHGLLDCVDIPACSNGVESGRMMRWVDVARLDEVLGDWSQRFEFARESVQGFIERPIAMPSMPSTTIASMFDSFGALRSSLMRKVDAEQIKYPSPNEWKKFYGLGREKTESRDCCLRLYPSASVTRVKDHNKAESILIGHYGMRTTS